MGGFEGADHINCHGTPLDMNALSGHLELLEEDYARLTSLQLRGVRESVGWRVCSRQGSAGQPYDFTRVQRVAAAAEAHGVQVLWTLMHYGIPDGVQVMGHDFAARFAEFAGLAARAIRRSSAPPSVYTAINEIGFLAWAYTQSHLIGSRQGADALELPGFEVKCRLVEAALAGIAEIRREDPDAKFLQVEPLIHVVAAPEHPELREGAATFSQYQWQAWDLMRGQLRPDLGGAEDALDLIGVNHYHDSQWELPSGQALEWNPPHPGRRAFADLLVETWHRYRRPMLIAETSHVGHHRANWLNMIVEQTRQAMLCGVPVEAICLYPVTDRPDWNNGEHWHNSGLWDSSAGGDARLGRVLACEYATAVRAHQRNNTVCVDNALA